MTDFPRWIELDTPPGVSLGSWLDRWEILQPVERDGREYRVVLIEDSGRIVLELATALYARSFVAAIQAAERFPLYRLDERFP